MLARDGALIVDDLADSDTVARINTEMAPFIADTPRGGDDFAGRATRRTGALIARSPSSHRLIRGSSTSPVGCCIERRATSCISWAIARERMHSVTSPMSAIRSRPSEDGRER